MKTFATDIQIAKGKEALVKHEISKAFDYLFIPALTDEEAQKLFLMTINTHTRLYLITEKQTDLLKEYAEKGNGLAQYAYGRYLEAFRPDDKALEQADEYFKSADAAGYPDGLYAQSLLFMAGHYGLVNREEANKMIDEASARGSIQAKRMQYRGDIFGQNGVEPNPQKAIDNIRKQIGDNESEDIAVVNPMFYSLIAQAYEELDDTKNAEKYYRKSIRMGFYESYSDLYLLHLNHDEPDADDLLDEGCKAGDGRCLLYRATNLMDDYDNHDEKEQKQLTEKIKQDLTTAVEMGVDDAPYFLGYAYYYERYGFAKDNDEAWNWFVIGTKHDDASAYGMIAIMISEDDNPYDVDEGLMEYCAIMALRNGDESMLNVVVESYRNGDFTDYASEIERYYIPEYDSQPHDDEEDEDEDDYYVPEMMLMAIIDTNGMADIHEYDVDGGWDDLPPMIGAKRLDAIRTQPLYDLSEKMGYTNNHITAWVDNMGLLKDLPMNPVGCRLYPGPIAGDLILTLEDNKYNPLSFNDIDELKKIIAELGATFRNLYLDDGPDDDGRYDAYS